MEMHLHVIAMLSRTMAGQFSIQAMKCILLFRSVILEFVKLNLPEMKLLCVNKSTMRKGIPPLKTANYI